MRGGSAEFINLSDLTYTGYTSIGSAKKQSQRDVAMNKNMKLIYDLLLKVDQKNQAVAKEITQVNQEVAKEITQVNNNLTQIQTQFEPTDVPINFNQLEKQNVINLLIVIVNSLKVEIQKP